MSATADATIKLSLADRVTEGIKRIEARFDRLQKRLSFDRIAKSTQGFMKSLGGLSDGIERTSKRLGMLTSALGLGAGGLAASLINMVGGVAEAGGHLEDLGNRLGIGVESLQAWQYAAKMNGVEAESLNKSIEKIGINASSAARGNKALADEFRGLGVSITDANGKMLPTDKILHKTMMALDRIKDPLKRNEVAFRLFGKSGVDMVQLLMDGGDGLNQWLREAYETGNVIGADVAKAGGEYGDSIDRLMMRLDGLRKFFAVQLLPAFKDVVDTVMGLIDANRQLIKDRLAEWGKRILQVIRDLLNPTSDLRLRIDALADRFNAVGDWLKPLVNRVGSLNAALIAIGAYIAAPLVTALTLATTAFFNLSAVILTTPFGWILAGVAAVAASVYVLYKKWDDFAAYWSGLWGRIKEAFSVSFLHGVFALLLEFSPVTHIARGLDAVVEYFTGFSLLDAGAGVIDSFLDGMKSAWGGLVSWLRESLASLLGWLPKSIRTRLGLGVDVAPVASNLSAKVAQVGRIDVPPLPSLGSDAAAANDPRVAAVKALTSDPVSASKVTAVDASTHIETLAIQAPPGADAKEIADAVKRALDDLDAEKRAAMNSALTD